MVNTFAINLFFNIEMIRYEELTFFSQHCVRFNRTQVKGVVVGLLVNLKLRYLGIYCQLSTSYSYFNVLSYSALNFHRV